MSDILSEQKRYYAARAPEYDDWWFRRGRYELEPEELGRWQADVAEAEAALDAFAPRGEVLELAAGTGIWTRRLVRLAGHVVAVDANPETLALNTPEVEHVVADLFAWQPDERFDLCFFSFWLSHVPEERFEAFWATVRAALKPGGRVFLVDNSAGGEPSHAWPRDGERETRTLSDGRAFTIVKTRRTGDELRARVAPLGFELDLHVTGNGHFLVGGGVRA
ncbi:MAG TPA: class I SAM-dependent methyltransferase [Gaiellaceae bacterium]|nr:class I SAM-dependent methyltransferase [Gaiellaceae bacterium]